MARANRHYLEGYVWHITHRCHKKEFLLKFAKDRVRWLYWLFQAKKRFGLCVLNYVVTSNHIHLLVIDTGDNVIPKSLQLIAGRTAQEYNRRKQRKGAYWEDRYHATAIENGDHLIRCLTYIDLNMVRAGVVRHPVQWDHGGYREIQRPPTRYGVIDRNRLIGLCGLKDVHKLKQEHHQWVEAALMVHSSQRQPDWSESIAMGSQGFVEGIKSRLGIRAQGRIATKDHKDYALREPAVSYNALFSPEKERLSRNNTCLWETNNVDSVC